MNDKPQRQKPKRPPPPLESFGENLMASLLKGALDGLELHLPYSTAVRFRARLHLLRSAMRNAKHPKYPLVAKTRVTISWPSGVDTIKSGDTLIPKHRQQMCIVRLLPNDSEFGPALRKAGVDPTLGSDGEADLPEPLSKTDMDAFLDSLVSGSVDPGEKKPK